LDIQLFAHSASALTVVVVDFSAVVVVSATARASRADRARTFSFMMKMEWNQPIELFLEIE